MAARATAPPALAAGVNAIRDHKKATVDRMNLTWRTVKATGDHFNPTRDHLNLILRTVESDRRSEKSDARSLNLAWRTVNPIEGWKKVIWRVAPAFAIGSPPALAAVTAFATRAKR
jgi:hypothetical protein